MDNLNFLNRKDGVADNLFIERWSPRSFSPELMKLADLKKLIDAARWSPSTLNEQPWVFFTASRESPMFQNFIHCLSEGNQVWARNAAVLGFLIGRNSFKDKAKENQLAQFDCGAAWMALTMQARILGYFTHGMGGIDRDSVRDTLGLDAKEHKVIMGFAVGKRANPDLLPEKLRIKEKPSARKSLEDIWHSL